MFSTSWTLKGAVIGTGVTGWMKVMVLGKFWFSKAKPKLEPSTSVVTFITELSMVTRCPGFHKFLQGIKEEGFFMLFKGLSPAIFGFQNVKVRK